MTKKHLHIFFSGLVQGVGFRYTAHTCADKHSVYGWAANLSDGRVELEIEGKASDIDNFLSALKAEFKACIKDTQIEELLYRGEYDDFQIKFY